MGFELRITHLNACKSCWIIHLSSRDKIYAANLSSNMIAHSSLFPLVLVLTSSLALTQPSSGPAIDLVSSPAQPNSSVLALSTQNNNLLADNSSWLGTPYAAPADATREPKCDGNGYGVDISRSSCIEAFGNIEWPAGDPAMSWGDRAHGLWDNNLPVRWQSSTCIVKRRFC